MPAEEPAAASPAPTLAALLGPALLLPKIALQQLFALPGDALPQAITRLTGLTQDDVIRFAAFTTSEEYDQALRHESGRFYCYALAGWLAYQSPLGEAIGPRLHGAGTEATAHTLAAAEGIAEGMVGLLAECAPFPDRVAAQGLHALFAQEKHGLVPCLPALVPPAAPPAPADASLAGWHMPMRPHARELNLFSLALHLTHAASYGVPHPLGRALADVAALGTPAELLALGRRFGAATALAPDGGDDAPELDVAGPDLIRLYLALQVLALLCVADLQPELMARLDPDPDHVGPWTDPDQQQALVAWVCTQAEAFGMIFDDFFGEEPAYLAAKDTARALAALV